MSQLRSEASSAALGRGRRAAAGRLPAALAQPWRAQAGHAHQTGRGASRGVSGPRHATQRLPQPPRPPLPACPSRLAPLAAPVLAAAACVADTRRFAPCGCCRTQSPSLSMSQTCWSCRGRSGVVRRAAQEEKPHPTGHRWVGSAGSQGGKKSPIGVCWRSCAACYCPTGRACSLAVSAAAGTPPCAHLPKQLERKLVIWA